MHYSEEEDLSPTSTTCSFINLLLGFDLWAPEEEDILTKDTNNVRMDLSKQSKHDQVSEKNKDLSEQSEHDAKGGGDLQIF